MGRHAFRFGGMLGDNVEMRLRSRQACHAVDRQEGLWQTGDPGRFHPQIEQHQARGPRGTAVAYTHNELRQSWNPRQLSLPPRGASSVRPNCKGRSIILSVIFRSAGP